MAQSCHMCGSNVAENGTSAEEVEDGFVCADCGELTCMDCKSIGVARDTDHCRRCRG
jgi:hypothetical protein